MDWLRDQLALVYGNKMVQYFSNPWEARDKYISGAGSAFIIETFLSNDLRYNAQANSDAKASASGFT